MTTATPRRTKREFNYYSISSLLSRNGVYNFLVGARGVGKTYSAKVYAIKKYLKTGEQFIYVRRYETELKLARTTLFADVQEQFPNLNFNSMGAEIKMRTVERDGEVGNWEVMGYALALSKAQQYKSVSFEKVTTIIFDEFIIEKGHIRYLSNEAKVFNDFYSTVDRYQDKTRVLFLANSVSIMNPYFVEYGINPHPDKEWIKLHEGFVVCHFPQSELFSGQVYQTRFGKFIKGTDYADYAVGSFFTDNNDALVRLKSSTSQYLSTLITRSGTVSIWLDIDDENTFYMQKKRPRSETKWVMRPELMRDDTLLITRSDPLMQHVRRAYAQGRCWFDSPQSRNVFAEAYVTC